MVGIHLVALLLGGRTHLLLEGAVRDVDAGDGPDADAEDDEEDDDDDQGVEDAYFC